MKKCILSAIGGAVAMLTSLIVIANFSVAKEQEPEKNEYEHIDFVSTITQEDCFICGEQSDPLTAAYWGEDNVGIVNLNTFDVLRLEINRYGNHGELIEEVAGYVQSSSMSDDDSYVHAWTHPDKAYSSVEITNVDYEIAQDSIQSHLCQTCLDTINALWFGNDTPAEYAIVSFAKRTIRPLMKCTPWFSAGDFGVDCEFKDNGTIKLLIHYCPRRYE